MGKLLNALREKYRTPQDALRSLGLDANLLDEEESTDMPKLSSAALVARTALNGYFRGGKLAQDATIDLTPIVTGLTSKNYVTKQPDIVAAVKKAVEGKLAKDADIEDLAHLLDAMKPDAVEADNMVTEPNSAVPGFLKEKEGHDDEPGDTIAKVKELLEAEGVAPEIIAKLDSFMADAGDVPDPGAEVDGPNEDEEPDDDKDKDAKDGIVPNEQSGLTLTKDEMNQAIKVAKDEAIQETLQAQRAIRDAERFIRPWVGELALDAACADDVYRGALKALKVAGADKMHSDALRPVLEAQAKPAPQRGQKSMAQDVKPEGSFAERFPNAAGVRLQ